MTAEQVFDAAQAHLPGISRATVEATMQRFVDRGLLRELLVDTLAVVYDSTVRPHHHVYDVDTRRVSDLAGEVRVLGVPDLGDLQVCGIDVVVRVRRINGARADSRSPAPAAPPPA
jgi:Fur family iron response transcriptional regulator